LRARLRAVRQQRTLSFERVAALTGIAKSSILAIEGVESRNVYLDQVVALAQAFDVPFLALALGWKGKRIPSGFVVVDVERLHDHVRACIRRERGALGTPALAERAGMEQSTLVRWESGEYRRIDLLRLYRLAEALDADLVSWLTVS
jgi:transcriptional regulator with XRE-family HTH domain